MALPRCAGALSQITCNRPQCRSLSCLLNVERRADGPGNAGQRQGGVPSAAKKVHRNGPRHNAGQDGLADGPPDDYDQVKLPDGADLRNEVKGDTQTSGSEGHQPPCAVAVGETAHHWRYQPRAPDSHRHGKADGAAPPPHLFKDGALGASSTSPPTEVETNVLKAVIPRTNQP